MAKSTNSRSMRYTCLDVRSPDVNFLMKSDTAVLIMTGSPTRTIHGADRLTRTSCPLSPCLSALFKKISTSYDKHLRHGTAYLGSSVFWEVANTLVATAGCKNKLTVNRRRHLARVFSSLMCRCDLFPSGNDVSVSYTLPRATVGWPIS